MQLAQRMSQLGTETAFEVLARAEALRAQGKDVINLGIGNPTSLHRPTLLKRELKPSKMVIMDIHRPTVFWPSERP